MAHERPVDLLIIVYMNDSIGYTGPNVDKFAERGICIGHHKIPFIIIGDVNMEPPALPTKWLLKLGAKVLTPEGMVGTCFQGPPEMYDYVIHSVALEGCLELQGDPTSTSKPHISLILAINRRPRSIHARQQRKPKEFPIIEYQKEQDQALRTKRAHEHLS